ncbi:hypothetical protein GUJ93_ZPchr0010g9329 [Zizania palustris]|uniref:Stress-response A/B barrel domain-containing protein n=1 Tax=Zizania palustris TaxID=103762 RepID=A0A8J5W8Z8_ZIZPA|nr:hypothetical protein GUJ93_ZPchr0010g9329 [Zizania palustris]
MCSGTRGCSGRHVAHEERGTWHVGSGGKALLCPQPAARTPPSPKKGAFFLPHPLLPALLSSTGNGIAARGRAHLRSRVACCARAWSAVPCDARAWPAAPARGLLRLAAQLMEKVAVETAAAGVENGAKASFGENFSPARAKGYQAGMVAVFDSVEELDAVEGDGKVEQATAVVRPLLDEVLVQWCWTSSSGLPLRLLRRQTSERSGFVLKTPLVLFI